MFVQTMSAAARCRPPGKERVPTEYLLTVYTVEAVEPPSPEAMGKMYQDVGTCNEQLKAEGTWVFARGMEPGATATVVRIEHGAVLTTDGPLVIAKGRLGGFWVIQARDLDTALAWAAQATAACQGPVEVRPFQEASI